MDGITEKSSGVHFGRSCRTLSERIALALSLTSLHCYDGVDETPNHSANDMWWDDGGRSFVIGTSGADPTDGTGTDSTGLTATGTDTTGTPSTTSTNSSDTTGTSGADSTTTGSTDGSDTTGGDATGTTDGTTTSTDDGDATTTGS